MRIKFFSILILIFFFLIIVSINQCNRINNLKNESERYKNNFNSINNLLNNIDSNYLAQINFNKEEFADNYAYLIDSLSDASRIKIKLNRVDELNKYKILYKTDSVFIWRDSIIPNDTIVIGKKIQFLDSCFKFSIFSPADSNVAQIKSELNLDAYAIIYRGKKRNQFKILGLPIFRYGKRIINTEVMTNCSAAKIKILNIKIIDE